MFHFDDLRFGLGLMKSYFLMFNNSCLLIVVWDVSDDAVSIPLFSLLFITNCCMLLLFFLFCPISGMRKTATGASRVSKNSARSRVGCTTQTPEIGRVQFDVSNCLSWVMLWLSFSSSVHML